MGKINILSDDIINVIAAGEIVERPAAVVKELLENAVDAESNRIEVFLQKSGKILIRVVDNGVGMSNDDAFLSLERHATSKLKTKSDLFNIRTMGFRGEAMPSISAVSRFTLISKELGSKNPAIKIYCERGHIISNEYVDLSSGTVIQVKNLFYNLPARKKQLRSDNTELTHIIEVINRIALPNFSVHFEVENNNHSIIKYIARKSLIERVMDVFSLEFSKNAIEIDYKDEYMHIYGYISQPASARKDWNQQYIFVNNRYIASRIIRHAIDTAYDTLLPRNRYPKGVIVIDIAPDEVDVNVHPTKIQVRFANSNRVHDTLVYALRRKLLQKSDFSAPEFDSAESKAAEQTDFKGQITKSVEQFIKKNAQFVETPEFERNFLSKRKDIRSNSLFMDNKPYESKAVTGSAAFSSHNVQIKNILGQVLNTYIVVEVEDGFALIDQHAAHERIRYELFVKQYKNSKITQQELLIPQTVDFSSKERALIDELVSELRKFGFELEYFGNNSYVVKSVPAILKEADIEPLFYEIVDEYMSGLKRKDLKERVDAFLKLISCRGAIKANQHISTDEMKSIIEHLFKCESPFTCPHGRPTVVVFVNYEIEKLFKRVM